MKQQHFSESSFPYFCQSDITFAWLNYISLLPVFSLVPDHSAGPESFAGLYESSDEPNTLHSSHPILRKNHLVHF